MNSQKKERHRADWINKWIVEYRTEQEPGWMWVNKMNIFRYENGEEEHCMELWNRDGKVKKIVKYL